MLLRSGSTGQERVVNWDTQAAVQPRLPLLVSLALFIVFILMLLTLGVVAAARTREPAQPPILPEAFLPGSELPAGIACNDDEFKPPCSVKLGGYDIYFRVHADTRTITRTLIPSRDYTIGQLLARWERPTGFTRNGIIAYVHWGARSALLYTRNFQLDSIVEFIQYDVEPLPSSSWRGFRLFE